MLYKMKFLLLSFTVLTGGCAMTESTRIISILGTRRSTFDILQ